MKEEWQKRKEMRRQEKENYMKMTPSEKVAYNLKGINSELKKLDPNFVEFVEPNVVLIESYEKENNIGSDCGYGREFCIDCGLNQIELNLGK